jgi:hypothetical protein
MRTRGRRSETRQLDQVEENLIWIATSPRSGSTWLLNLIGMQPRVVMIDEPLIGVHLGAWSADMLSSPLGPDAPTDRQLWHRLRGPKDTYFFAESFRDAWGPHLRAMLLARFGAHVERFGGGVPKGETPVVCIKEPVGSQASDMIMDVLPRARFLLLLRDPRDVVSSLLDAYRQGTWHSKGFPDAQYERRSRADRVEEFAIQWRGRTEISLEAYEKHDPDRRLMIRYEDLRVDAESWLTRACEWAGLPTDRNPEFVQRLAFERAPEAQRGEGEFRRKAKPGGWREDLAPHEVAVIETICAEPMRRLGYERSLVTA